jgi:hypothetical protein
VAALVEKVLKFVADYNDFGSSAILLSIVTQAVEVLMGFLV